MMHEKDIKDSFFGLTTLGEKGQAVVPAKAREKMRLKKGEKLLVFSLDDDMLLFYKMDGLEKFATHLTEKLQDINAIIKKNHK